MPLATVSYGGLNIRGMEFTLNRGITPSVATLFVVPFDQLDVPPGDLRFGVDGNDITLTNCAVASCNRRIRYDGKWELWAVQVMDRRWMWENAGAISGTYNDHLQGIGALKTAAYLMSLCLQALGENNADLSRAPQTVYPYVSWDSTNPALALEELCERCACEVVLNPLSDQVEIWPLGTGRSSPTGLSEVTPKYRFVPRAYVPSAIEVRGGAALFQYRLLLEAVGRGTNLVQGKSPDWMYGVNPKYENFNWPSVTNTVGSELALESGWRYYRVKGQENGGLNVPGLSFPIQNTSQYVLKDFILYTAYDDRTQLYQRIDPYIEGNFWTYSDLPSNSVQVYIGGFKLWPEKNLLRTDQPLVAVDGNGYITEPTLYLQVGYNVKDVYGTPIGLNWTANVGGTGGRMIIRRPECFAAYAATGNTEAFIGQELAGYAQLFYQKYQQPYASELTYGGMILGTLDGNVAQATWTIHPTKGVRTQVCEQEELNTTAVSAKERMRREWLRRLIDKDNRGPFA